MTCNPIVIPFHGQYQAWCKGHKPIWESPWTNQHSLAVHWANEHRESGT